MVHIWSWAFGLSVLLNLLGLIYVLKDFMVIEISSVISSGKMTQHDHQPQIVFNQKGKRNENLRRALHSKDYSSYTRKIFIDLGANDGTSIQYVLDKPEATTGFGGAGQGGEEGGALHGLGSDGDWHVIAFEANKGYNPSLDALKSKYLNSKLVKDFTVYGGVAIGDHNGIINLYMDTPEKDQGSAGASVMEGTGSYFAYNNSSPVPIMDIADVFKHFKISKSDFVAVKIDIEGSEFNVLRRMLSHGLVHLVHILAVEWHDGGYFQDPAKAAETSQQHMCLSWILGDFPGLQLQRWSRR